MILPILYTISDFLVDEKAELKRLSKLLKKAKDPKRRTEIEEQMQYIFGQGLQALRRHEFEVPDSIRNYFLGNGPKPSIDQISEELAAIHGYQRVDDRIGHAILVILVTLLILLAIFL